MGALLKVLGSVGVVLLPALYGAVFAYLRGERVPITKPFFEGASLPHEAPFIADALVFVAFGFLAYYFHRGVFHRFVWIVQRWWYGIPQAEFHQRICESQGLGGPIRDRIGISQACLFQLEATQGSSQYLGGTKSFNMGSHFLYLHNVVILFFGLTDVSLLSLNVFCRWRGEPRSCWLPGHLSTEALGMWIGAWAIGWFLVLAVALAYDRLADYREVVFLTQHQAEYSTIVRQLAQGWPSATTAEFGGEGAYNWLRQRFRRMF